jgi:hypothetical protein
MKSFELIGKILLGACLASLLMVSSCCVGKLFDDDDEPYVQDLQGDN